MNFYQYQTEALRTARMMPSLTENLLHAQIGLCTEVGEFATEVKRLFAYRKELTPEMRDHMAEELGDVLWYIAVAADTLNVSMTEMAEGNIAKLRKRYPEKYSDELAEARLDKGGVSPRES